MRKNKKNKKITRKKIEDISTVLLVLFLFCPPPPQKGRGKQQVGETPHTTSSKK
jgi:hypothetical protein